MSTTVALSRRQAARVACVGLFVAVQVGTDLFVQYPPLAWAGLLGLVAVFADAMVCTGRRLRNLRKSDGRDPDY